MIIDYGGRRTGKTIRLIGWVLQDVEHRTIMCHTQNEADRVLKLIKSVAPEAPSRCVVSAGQSKHGLQGRNHLLAIDNAEMVLGALLGMNLAILTLNDPNIAMNDSQPGMVRDSVLIDRDITSA